MGVHMDRCDEQDSFEDVGEVDGERAEEFGARRLRIETVQKVKEEASREVSETREMLDACGGEKEKASNESSGTGVRAFYG